MSDWTDRMLELQEDPHVVQAAERTRRAMEVSHGIRDTPDLGEVGHNISMGIAILEENPEAPMTHGQILVVRGPMDGYSMWVRVADVYNMHLQSFWRDRS